MEGASEREREQQRIDERERLRVETGSGYALEIPEGMSTHEVVARATERRNSLEGQQAPDAQAKKRAYEEVIEKLSESATAPSPRPSKAGEFLSPSPIPEAGPDAGLRRASVTSLGSVDRDMESELADAGVIAAPSFVGAREPRPLGDGDKPGPAHTAGAAAAPAQCAWCAPSPSPPAIAVTVIPPPEAARSKSPPPSPATAPSPSAPMLPHGRSKSIVSRKAAVLKLESPMERARRILDEMKEKYSMAGEDRRALDVALGLLTSDRPFLPKIVDRLAAPSPPLPRPPPSPLPPSAPPTPIASPPAPSPPPIGQAPRAGPTVSPEAAASRASSGTEEDDEPARSDDYILAPRPARAAPPGRAAGRAGPLTLRRGRTRGRARALAPLRPDEEQRPRPAGKRRSSDESNIKHTKQTHVQLSLALVLSNTAQGQLREVLSTTDEWDFDCFRLAGITRGRPLFAFSYMLFLRYDFVHKFNFKEKALRNFLKALEDRYHANPFHNSTHATCVMHACHYFLTRFPPLQYPCCRPAPRPRPRLRRRPPAPLRTASSTCRGTQLSDVQTFAVLLAAAAHDIGHPGVNNTFLVKTGAETAIVYNDRSVLENFHASQLFGVAVKEGLFAGLPEERYRELRSLVIDMILATDMTRHFELLSSFKGRVTTPGAAPLDMSIPEDRSLVLQIVMKCADVCNPTKEVGQMRKWVEVLVEEFYGQGDRERDAGMQISPFMDRTKPAVPQSQLGFVDFVIAPLFGAMEAFVGAEPMAEITRRLRDTRDYWTAEAAKSAPEA
eukprot:tig00001094_g6997.t1